MPRTSMMRTASAFIASAASAMASARAWMGSFGSIGDCEALGDLVLNCTFRDKSGEDEQRPRNQRRRSFYLLGEGVVDRNTLVTHPSAGVHLATDLALPFNHKAQGGESFGAHGAVGMQATRGDSDLCAKTQLPAIGKACGGVDHDTRGLNAAAEGLRGADIIADDRFGVVRIVALNMFDRSVDVVDDADGNIEAQVFGFPVAFGGGDDVFTKLLSALASVDGDAIGLEFFDDGRQKFLCGVLVHQQGFDRIANARPRSEEHTSELQSRGH